MTNLRRQNNIRTKNAILRALSGVALVLAVLIVDSLSGGYVRNVLRSASSGFLQIAENLPGASFFHTQAYLATERDRLASELASERERSVLFGALQDENTQLRALVHLATSTRGITEPVLSSFQSSPYGTFLIGNDGVREGNLVLSPSGFVLGRISDVEGNTALVTMIFAHGSTVEAGLGSTTAELTGEGGSNASVRIPRGVNIATGSVAVLRIASNRPIGTVGALAVDPAKAYTTVLISLPVNLASLRYVYVVSR